MDFCEIDSKTIIKTYAKFHFVMILFRVMTVDLTDVRVAPSLYNINGHIWCEI